MVVAEGQGTSDGDRASANPHPEVALHRPPGPGLLPDNEPTLVLFTCEDPTLAARLDAVALGRATVLDLRSGTVWAEVPDGRAFVQTMVDEFPQHLQLIRVAFAPPEAGLDRLLGRAMAASSLTELANALDQAGLAAQPPLYEVHFQPLVSLTSRSVIGFESLIRASIGGAPVEVDDLLLRAEQGGWLADLDQLGRALALRSTGDWLGNGLLFLNLLAPGGVFDVEAVRSTIALALERGLVPDQIVLEVTERNRYPDLATAAAQIDELRSMGVRIAIDDVGDGYASLLLVSRFRPDVVKIAGGIVTDLPGREAEAIIGAIVDLAHQAGTWVVAESIETQEQALRLARLGVDWGQGHFLGPPTLPIGSPLAADRPPADRE